MAGLFQQTIATLRALYTADQVDGPLRVALDGEPVRWNLLSGSKVDTGWWLIRPAVRLVVTSGRFFLYAPGKNRLLEARPLSGLNERTYNHFTGEWLLPSTGEYPARRLRLPPDQVRRITQSIAVTPTSL